MPTGDEGSVTHWLGELRAGDREAAQLLGTATSSGSSSWPAPGCGPCTIRGKWEQA